MYCELCQNPISIKDTKTFISFKCKCKCSIFYPDGYFVTIPKDKYKKVIDDGGSRT